VLSGADGEVTNQAAATWMIAADPDGSPMRNKTVISIALVIAGFVVVLLLADPGQVHRKTRAQRVQGVNVVRKVSFTLKTNDTPALTPANLQ